MKSIMTIVAGFVFGLLFVMIGNFSIEANAYTNQIYVNVEHMTAAEAASYSSSDVTITASDLKCTLIFHDVAPFAAIGTVTTFNTQYYSAVTEAPSYLYKIDLDYRHFSGMCNNNYGRASFTYMSTTMNTIEGPIAIFFLRPKNNNIPSNTPIVYGCAIADMIDTQSQSVIPGLSPTDPPIPVSTGFNICLPYTVGDLDDDGDVDLADVMILMVATTSTGWNANAPQNTLTISVAPGMYGSDPLVTGTFFIPVAADVNCDGIIDSTDISLMQEYYDDYMLFYLTGNEYIGSDQLYEVHVNP